MILLLEPGGRAPAPELIYPDHLKYGQVTRQPYSALFERLRLVQLTSPDTLLLCSGVFLPTRFSHLCGVRRSNGSQLCIPQSSPSSTRHFPKQEAVTRSMADVPALI